MATPRAKLRTLQIQAALPWIAPLLDLWEHMSNDVKGSLRVDDEHFCQLMGRLEAAWMGDAE
jgi:hypothetical protein